MSKRRRRPQRRQPRQPEPTGRSSTRIEELCEGIIEAGWLVTLALVPLVFNVYSARTYEPDKVAVLCSLVLVMVAAWLWKLLSGGRAFRPVVSGRIPEQESSHQSLARRFSLLGQPLLWLAALLAVSLIVGSFLSIDPRLSWLGSYPRSQGAWTQLSYLAVFLLLAAHLRTRAQLRRIVFVTLLTSVPISLFALFQAAGLDPVPHSFDIQRAFSTLGNPIFLGAYLLMVLFIALLELVRSLARFSEQRAAGLGLYRLVVLAIVLLHVTALVLTQSRGPFLGALAGAYIFFLVLALIARASVLVSPAPRSVLARALRWAWAAVIGIGLAGGGLLVTLNLPDSPLARLQRAPYIGRLGSVLDFESRTARVRFLIWDGVIDLLASDDPLVPPGGAPDRLEPVRGLVGYGPETLSLAVNRHIRPELGQIEGRGDMPDRSHNETFDVLVMHGVLGYAIRLGIYCTAFLLALRYLGLVKSGAQRLSFWVNLSLGAALGALGPYLLQGAWTLSGVGLPAGMIAGLVVFVTLEALIGQRSAPARPPDAETALIVALLAGFIAHVVEIHFGIAIVSTRLYFWSLLALLVVVSNGWLEKPASPAGAASEEAPAQQTRRAKTAAERLLSTRLPPAGLLAGLLAVAICMPLTYGLVLNSSNHSEAMPLFVSSLWQSSAEGSSRPGTLFWLLVLTLAAAAALAAGLLPGSGGRELRRRVLQAALLGGIGSLALALVHSRLLSGVGRMRAAGHGPLDAALAGSEMFAALVWLAVLLVVALGATLGWRPGDLRSWSRRPAVLSVGGGLGLALASVWLIDTANLDPIRADTLLKQARALVAADRPEIGLRLLDKACELNQKEPMLFLHRGQAAMRAAARATTPETEASYLEAAETTLLRARELAPLDPDHSANLARFLVRQAAARDQPQERERLRQRAETEYRATLALRPSSVLFINELAPLLIQSGKLDEAQAVLDRAREIDDRYAPTLLNLARLHQTRAAAAGRTRQLSPFVDSLERAIAMYERAVLLDPKLETAKKETDKLRGVMTQLSAAMPSKDRLRELYGDEAAVHLGLGRLHLDSGRLDRALAHAQIAHELAREARMDDSRALLHEVEAALRQR